MGPKKYIKYGTIPPASADISSSPRAKVNLSSRPLGTQAARGQYYNITDLPRLYEFPKPTGGPVSVGVLSFGEAGVVGDLAYQGSDKVSVLNKGFGSYGTVATYTNMRFSWYHVLNSEAHINWRAAGIKEDQMPKIIAVIVSDKDIPTPVLPSKGSQESMEDGLDLSVIGGACPNPDLTIILYLCNFMNIGWSGIDYVFDLTQYQFTLNNRTIPIPKIINVSWELWSCELYPEPDWILLPGEILLFKPLKDRGITTLIASGDYGSSHGGSKYLTTYPQVSPYATIVGGSNLICPNDTYDLSTSEVVWSDGGGTAGGGISALFNLPLQNSVTKGSTVVKNIFNKNVQGRSYPDVTLHASVNNGLLIEVAGGTRLVGGTSAAAPLYAGYLACLNQLQGCDFNYILYSTSSSGCMHDITSGNTKLGGTLPGYNATKGWDIATGFGSINGPLLTNRLKKYKEISYFPLNVNASGGSIVFLTGLVTASPYGDTLCPSLKWTSSDTNIFRLSSLTGTNVSGTCVNNGTSVITTSYTDSYGYISTASGLINVTPYKTVTYKCTKQKAIWTVPDNVTDVNITATGGTSAIGVHNGLYAFDSDIIGGGLEALFRVTLQLLQAINVI